MNLTADQWNTVGAQASEKAQFLGAIGCFRKALALDPRRHDIRANLVDNLRRSWQFKEAMAELQIASADGMFDKLQFIAACLALDMGASERAVELFTPRLCTTPYGRFCRSQALLNAGQFKEGFAEHEARLDMLQAGNPPVPRWHGESLEGKTVAIHHEQGYGDSIAYFRFLEHLPRNSIVLGVPGALYDLFSGHGYQVVSTNEPLQGVDYYLPLMSLPHELSLDEISTPEPYIRPQKRFDIPANADTKLRVGIVWRAKAGQQHTDLAVNLHGEQKSLPLEHLLSLGNIPGVTLYSLQTGGAEDIKRIGAEYLIYDLASKTQGFGDLANFMARMDLVVSVDTAPLHLAGAMGIKCLALLACRNGWPFPGTGKTTPWYSTMGIVRQPSPNDWPSVIAEVRREIKALL